ncbi:MAG: hypothetical protein QGF68_19140 [Nitrospinota bacterium]|jgi:hypothetical protein|nr:hypothetical protein [Nitrospinota bacterium]
MSSLENLEQLEHQLRALLSERKQLKSRLDQLEADAPAKGRDKDFRESQRVKDLLARDRSDLRSRVESMLAAISRLSQAS